MRGCRAFCPRRAPQGNCGLCGSRRGLRKKRARLLVGKEFRVDEKFRGPGSVFSCAVVFEAQGGHGTRSENDSRRTRRGRLKAGWRAPPKTGCGRPLSSLRRTTISRLSSARFPRGCRRALYWRLSEAARAGRTIFSPPPPFAPPSHTAVPNLDYVFECLGAEERAERPYLALPRSESFLPSSG